jgi:hypothetical protein
VTDIPKTMKRLFQKCNEGSHAPSLHDLSIVIEEFASPGMLDDIYIVADALDECFKKEDRCEVLEIVGKMCAIGTSNIHVLVTSRPENDINKILTPILTTKAVTLEGLGVDSDIRTYVMNQLESDSKLKKWSPDIQSEILQALINGAKGM